jgi:hypothetical protein
MSKLDLPVARTSPSLFIRYLTALIMSRIEQHSGKESPEFSIPICGNHLVEMLSLVLSGPSKKKRKRVKKSELQLTPLSESKRRKVFDK